MRIAAHKSRRGRPATKQAESAPAWIAASSRAAEAAARVAARYAHAPSYSEMETAESLSTAPTVAAIATPVALDGAVRSSFEESPVVPSATCLSELELKPFENHSGEIHPIVAPAPTSARDWAPAIATFHLAPPSSLEDWEHECAQNRWEPDLSLRPPGPVPAAAPDLVSTSISAAVSDADSATLAVASLDFKSNIEARWEWPEMLSDPIDSEEIRPVEPDLPIHANLIQFPRELVATRKIRPRRAEGPFATASSEMQLNIFEVDPDAISTYADCVGATATEAWPEPAWAEIELEPQTQDEEESRQSSAVPLEVQLAPFNRRAVAALADSALIAGVVSFLALVAAAKIVHPPAMKIIELGVVLAILLVGLFYHTLFLTVAGTTPGMKFSGISLCTFDGQIPTRAQLRSRLGALLLSVAPVGLGVAWALFDDGHLSWHDRLSRTYLREN